LTISGHYSTAGQTSCTQCTAGYSCTTTTQSQCGTGSYSSAGSTSCTTCPAGHECSSVTTGTPTECTAGTYAAAGAASCSPCGKGFKCPNNGMDSQIACTTGQYQPSTGQTTCIDCPAGKLFHFVDAYLFLARLWNNVFQFNSRNQIQVPFLELIISGVMWGNFVVAWVGLKPQSLGNEAGTLTQGHSSLKRMNRFSKWLIEIRIHLILGIFK
jgi:hypothetical protein